MSRWVVLFEDTNEMVAYRKQQGKKHAEYIHENKLEILIGGGFRISEDAPYTGGMWIMEVKHRERAVELIENDPYYHPEYRQYRLFLWSKILENEIIIL